MATRDVFQTVDQLGSEVAQRIVERLEFRGNDPTFVQMRERYLDRIGLAPEARILDLGCGTGVVARAIARRYGFAGTVTGVDVSEALIGAARCLADEEGVGDRIRFRVGDSHALEDGDASYDAVIAHTLVSHVVDPDAVIAEAARVLHPDGTLALFDGDYASLTLGAGEPKLNAAMVEGILGAIVANPHVMRSLPTRLHEAGLEVHAFLADVLAEAGRGDFFANILEAYVPMAIAAGTVGDAEATAWHAAQREATEAGTFFGACNYYTYLARKPG